MELPEKVKSASLLKVPVKLTGIAAGEEARVTLAAVDVGVLNLTRFEAPKPEGWFFGQRRLGAELRDLYGRLIDGMRAERGRLRSGGDSRRRVDGRQPARRGDAGAVLRHRQSRRGRHGQRRVPAARLQRHGARVGGGVERRQGRLGLQGRDRARRGGADRVGAALPDARRPGPPGAGRAQRRRAGRRLPGSRPVRAGARRDASPRAASSGRSRSAPASASARPSS